MAIDRVSLIGCSSYGSLLRASTLTVTAVETSIQIESGWRAPPSAAVWVL